jgi:hypothetical protein
MHVVLFTFKFNYNYPILFSVLIGFDSKRESAINEFLTGGFRYSVEFHSARATTQFLKINLTHINYKSQQENTLFYLPL